MVDVQVACIFQQANNVAVNSCVHIRSLRQAPLYMIPSNESAEPESMCIFFSSVAKLPSEKVVLLCGPTNSLRGLLYFSLC